ncbi:hypothetical protein [Arachidicoccus terrestris]|uniref:hypothetical protein n=1 Tax=Arachidicoccus terrestris TaxID=2875539 RepID=UPI001CC38E4C|nr:hypothetical protein [Arachidicoccus terrestris]UAY54277.1 hypothetical protein K9M52_12525 [Arachidicoccus terrestris]
MENDQKEIFRKGLSFLFITLLVSLMVNGLIRQCNLNADHVLENAKIYKAGAEGGKNSGFWIDYTFQTKGENFEGSSLYGINKLNVPMVRKYFIGKTFPVAYYPSDPSNSHLLILPEDFDKFGYEFPDSLNWVKDLIEKESGDRK